MPNTAMEQYRRLVDEARKTLDVNGDGGKIRIQVGSATCENAAGAAGVQSLFKTKIGESGRTDILLHMTGCTGRCSLEPIVSVLLPGRLPISYQQVDAALAERIFAAHVLGGQPVSESLLEKSATPEAHYQLLFCGSAACVNHGAEETRARFQTKLKEAGLPPGQVEILPANCFGLCPTGQAGQGSHVLVSPGNVLYRIVTEADIDEIIREHLTAGRVVGRLRVTREPIGQRFFELYGQVAFFNRQSRVALRNAGIVDPSSIDEYLDHDGFRALAKVLTAGDREAVVTELSRAKLRGRGGAGYPTGTKWASARQSPETTRYMICNGDEGDPGAFMDRSMLESDPFAVIEGMLIGGFAIGAERGFFYIRSEYPLAVKRVQKAIVESRRKGLLGQAILGSDFNFDLEVRLGGGAFVCGEETALIASIEGQRGWPKVRPPYPSQRGLWGKPTVINNVETLANVPAVIDWGADWFSRLGTATSGGTKVFALAGKIRHTGLVEVPMGTTLRDIVEGIGGGIPDGKKLKAIQTGGPAGGCLPASLIDLTVDYETLTQAGSIMGSGGMIVMDEDDCMVDIAKFYMQFCHDESCGQCTPCREGTKRMLEILERITAGTGKAEDLVNLERLAKLTRKASLCGLGRASSNPVLSTLRYFRDEYEAHVSEKRCPAGRCAMPAGKRGAA